MIQEISKIRFYCRTHDCTLQNCGSGRIFEPTHAIAVDPLIGPEDEMEQRKDKDGWLHLDTSELYCPTAPESCDQEWVIQAG